MGIIPVMPNPSSTTKEKKRHKKTKPKLSRLHKPEKMSLEEWQIGLRRQFGREQTFTLKNLGDHPVASDFQITNPTSKGAYRVSIRGTGLGDNFCSCPDFTTNTLGTCKHIEFTLAKVLRSRQALRFLESYSPAHSEIYLRYGAQR